MAKDKDNNKGSKGPSSDKAGKAKGSSKASEGRKDSGKGYSRTGGSFGSDFGSRDSYGSFKGSKLSVTRGGTLHEGFSKAVGGAYSGSRTDHRESRWGSKQASSFDYGFAKPSSISGLTGEGTFADMMQGIKGMFQEDKPFMGGFRGYGFQREDYMQRDFADRGLSEQWVEDKMATVAGVMSNPLVSGAMFATGFGALNLGVQAASVIKDMAEGDIDMTKGLGRLASTAIKVSPVGAALGPFRGVITSGLEDVSKVPGAVAGLVGGKIGGTVGGAIASSLTSNPYVGAGITTASAIGGSLMASKGVQQGMLQPSGIPPASMPQRGEGKPSRSPLLPPSDTAQEADVTRYARTVAPMPFYGSPFIQQLPTFGLA